MTSHFLRIVNLRAANGAFRTPPPFGVYTDPDIERRGLGMDEESLNELARMFGRLYNV